MTNNITTQLDYVHSEHKPNARIITSKIIRVENRPNNNTKQKDLQSVIANLDEYDLSPPYQRGDVWQKPFKVKLIQSILSGVPINTIHLVNKLDTGYWTLDGRQRFSTIKEFVEGSFYTPIEIDGKTKKIWYKDVKQYPDLQRQFNNCSLTICYWDFCDFNVQKEIFNSINNSKPLPWVEKAYCNNFLPRFFFEYLYADEFRPMHDFFPSGLANQNHRYRRSQLIHSILFLSFGEKLDEQFRIGSTDRNHLVPSAAFLQELFEKKEVTSNSTKEEFLQALGWKSQAKIINNACKWTRLALLSKNVLKNHKRFNPYLLIDIISFFIKKCQENVLTNTIVEQNLDKLLEFIVRWRNFKHQKENYKIYKEHTGRDKEQEIKFTKMEEIFLQVGFSNSPVKRSASEFEKGSLALQAPALDPITKVPLTDENSQIDHVNPTKPTEIGNLEIISSIVNRQKSDNTPETLEKLLQKRI